MLSTLRQSNSNLTAISKTIYNVRDKIRHDNLQGRTPIQALLDKLKEESFEYDFQYSENGHLTHLFFAHPISIVLTKTYSSVLLMDCTYKINKFRMPLLHIIGMTSFNTTFSSCFAFLKSEQEEDYEWALIRVARIFKEISKPQVIISDQDQALMHAIRTIFPESQNFLYVWHIEKNILTNCRNQFPMDEEWIEFLGNWITVIKSKTEEDFNKKWEELAKKYNKNLLIVKYLQDTWLPLKKHFVSLWTDRYLHLDNVTTSRVEGFHTMLKKYLQVSTGDLYVIYERISLALENQHQEIQTIISQEMI
ncbi:2675_t:CDS:1 [Acaulospora morrowiae]|uniref:2675_t:CDS:1 n=1 Tax=Acaulospora morrowiae TaxID=94023 RepID=A0A9N9F1L9_9GLOM|nr:2675_t:CDS:1 [Acaulospora morrowiae]